jgi:hypothetical protein
MESNPVISAPVVDFEEFSQRLRESLEDPTELVEPPSSEPEMVASTTTDDPKAFTHRLEDLPKELGVLLASVGVLGVILPGIAGTPALIAGGLVLWPKTFSKVEDWFENRFPETHRNSMQQVGRFLDDLERRYPTPTKS